MRTCLEHKGISPLICSSKHGRLLDVVQGPHACLSGLKDGEWLSGQNHDTSDLTYPMQHTRSRDMTMSPLRGMNNYVRVLPHPQDRCLARKG